MAKQNKKQSIASAQGEQDAKVKQIKTKEQGQKKQQVKEQTLNKVVEAPKKVNNTKKQNNVEEVKPKSNKKEKKAKVQEPEEEEEIEEIEEDNQSEEWEDEEEEEEEEDVEEHFFAGKGAEGAFKEVDQKEDDQGLYDKEGMLQKVESIQEAFRRRLKVEKGGKIPWNEHLSLVSDKRIDIVKGIDVSEDIQREVQFYNTTLVNAQIALKYLTEEGVATRRPDDYFAEMFKSDKIMNKIRTKLVMEQESIKTFEESKQRQESRKLQRILRAKKEQLKSKEKRDNVTAIDKWKEEIKKKGDKAKDLSEFMLNTGKGGKAGGRSQDKGKNPLPVTKKIFKPSKDHDGKDGNAPTTSSKFGTDMRGKGGKSYRGDDNKGGKSFGGRDGKFGGNRGGDRGGKSFGGDRNGRGGDRGGKSFGGNRGGKSFGGDRGGKSFGGDRGGKSFGGDRGGKSFGGDRGGKSFGGDRGSKSFGGDRGGKSFGGDRGGKSFGGDRGGKSFSGKGGRPSFGGSKPPGKFGKSIGGPGGKSFGGSKGGKSFGGSKGGKSFGGSKGGKSFGGSKGGKSFGGKGGRR